MRIPNGKIEFRRKDNHQYEHIDVNDIGFIKISDLTDVIIVMENGQQIPVVGSVEWVLHRLKNFVRERYYNDN